MKKYGEFKGDAYVLRRMDTPRAWFNMLSNDHYILSLSQLGSGHSIYRCCLGNQVTRDPFPTDDAGRFFYVRDAKTGRFWSPTVWPVEIDSSAFERWSCTYRQGSMEWDLARDGMEMRLTAAVPLDDNMELYRMELVNRGPKPRRLDLFMSLDWLFQGVPHDPGRSLPCDFDLTAKCLVADLETAPEFRYFQTGFMATSEPMLTWDGNRRDFLGQPGSIAAPLAVRRGRCSNTPCGRMAESPIGAVQTGVTLKSGERKTVIFLAGVCENREAVAPLRRKYIKTAVVDAELARVDAWWREHSSRQVMRGNGKQNRVFFTWANTWLKNQVEQNFKYTRYAGERGYRDVLQDSAGMRLLNASHTRARILEALSHQKESGYAPRQYPVEPWGTYDWRDYRDSPFWIAYALEKYIKETGDTEILRERVPFFDRKEPDTVYGHARRAMDYLWRERGAHGLCLIGVGDWLDSLNHAGVRGKGESVWLSIALCYGLREMERLAPMAGAAKDAAVFHKRRMEMAAIINRKGWDGRWYLMAYDDDGVSIGSKACPDGGKIFVNPQSWAVLADVADAKRARTVMQSCDEHLKFDTGYLCFAPMYSRYDATVGRISVWPTEGASVYVHATAFKIAADCVMGEGDRAWETLRRIVPAGEMVALEETGAEPFSVPNAYTGPQWPRPKWSAQGWWTATTDWILQTLVEQIFGARADYDGLRIDPCLPRDWTEARIERTFRGSVYNIRITKRKGICRGTTRVRLDGRVLPGNLIPPDAKPGSHTVEVCIK